jgi:hypothetical protein
VGSERAGCFIDFADDIKGGPLQLWKGFFGGEDDSGTFKGIRAWIKEGRLPYDVGVYDPRAFPVANTA